MRNISLLVLIIGAGSFNAFGAKPHAGEVAVERLANNPSKSNVIEFAGYLRRIGSFNPSPRTTASYLLIQKTLLAIPGHAQYFADVLEEERSKLKPGEYRGSYTRSVFWYLQETLVHLPSPETVKVLGHYLNDDRDTPASPLGSGDYPGPAMVAFEALSKIGLRNLPVVDTSVADPSFRDFKEYEAAAIQALRLLQRKKEAALASYRTWWLEVDYGKLAFSFKGQAVDHRFNPDGTWVSTPIANPPDDAPKPPPSTAPPRDYSTPPSPPEPPPAAGTSHLPPWPWLAGGALAMLATAWLFLKSSKPPAA